jgi:hypothetical protein
LVPLVVGRVVPPKKKKKKKKKTIDGGSFLYIKKSCDRATTDQEECDFLKAVNSKVSNNALSHFPNNEQIKEQIAFRGV